MRGAKIRNAEERLEPLIHVVRGQRVILDADLARLYGVTTKALNQAIKRNVDRFPVDFAFQLSAAGDKLRWSQIVTTSQKYRRSGLRPWVFAEHGALMAANVLRSERAVQMSIFVIRAFVRLREHVAANAAIQSGLPKSTGRCFSTTRRCATSTANCSPCSLRLLRRRSAASAFSAAFSSVSTLRRSGSDPDSRVFFWLRLLPQRGP